MNWVLGYAAIGLFLITGSRLLTNQQFPDWIDIIISMTCWPYMLYLSLRKAKERK